MASQKLMILFYDMGLGGIQKKIIDISRYISEKHPKISIVICLIEKKGAFLNEVPKNVTVESPPFLLGRLNFLWLIIWLAWQNFKHNPHVILSYSSFSSIRLILSQKIIFWKKTPIIIGEDITTSIHTLRTEKEPKKCFDDIKKYYPLASKILVQTIAQKRDLEQIIGRKYSSKIIVSPNWLPLSFPSKNTQTLSRHTDIIFIGRIDQQKNLSRFVKIISLLTKDFPNIKVKIVGDGFQFEDIKSLVKKQKLQNNISLYHFTDNPSKFYLDSKIFLLTSDYEGFPLTIMEAISCGCYPIINNLQEIKPFFKDYSKEFTFNNNLEAVKLIKKALLFPHQSHLSFYQQKIAKDQLGLIAKYVDLTLYT